MTTHFVNDIAVEVSGAGDAVVCIHGLGGTSNTWTPLMSALGPYKVLRIDLPGSGRSPTPSGELTIDTLVEAISGVLTHFEITRAHWVGHSLGTIVCQHFAQKYPDVVRSLTLFGPLVCPPDAGRPNILARARKAATEGHLGMQEIADAIVQGAVSASTRQDLPVTVALVRESVMRQDAAGYSKSCEALANAQSASLEQIQSPVLMVTGAEDGVGAPASVEVMASRLPNARFVVLPGCGHWTTFERPKECASELAEFLKSV